MVFCWGYFFSLFLGYFFKINTKLFFRNSSKKELVPFTRQEIANFTGLRVETVIRAFSKMKEEKKIDIINDMAELSKSGTVFSQNYSINSDYDTMKYELELHRKNRNKTRAVNWLSGLLYSCVEGLELLSEDKFNEDYQLVGWSDRLNMQHDEINDVFSQLYAKYNKNGLEPPPELQLLFILGGSAILTMHGNRKGKTTYTPEEIQKLREKSLQDALRKKMMTEKQVQKMNTQTAAQMNHLERLNKLKQDMEEQEEKQKKIVQNYEENIMDSPQDDLYLERQKQLDEMRNKINQETEAEASNDSKKSSKKTVSQYTRGGTKKKGVKMNF